MDKFWKKIFGKDNKKFKIKILCLFIAGIIFMAAGNLFGPKEIEETAKEDKTSYLIEESSYSKAGLSDEEYIEKRLEEILSQVYGAGQVMVMIRTSSRGEIVIAEEFKSSESTETNESGEKLTEITEEKRAVLLENKDGSQIPLIIKNIENPIEGVLIVAEGGGDIAVKESLVSAAEALLNLPANKIQVLKMK